MISRNTLGSIAALLIGAALLNLGLGLQGTLVAMRAEIEAFPTFIIGIIMSSYYGGFVVGSVIAPRIVQRVGHIRTFAALASIASSVTVLHSVFIDPLSWLIFRALTGLCFAGLAVVMESWLNERATSADRGSVLSIYMTTILGATVLGQFLLNIAPPSGFELFIFVSVALSLALVPVALSTSPMPDVVVYRRLPWQEVYDKSPVGVVSTFAGGLVIGSLWGLGPVYAKQVGLSTFNISLFMSLLIGGGLISQIPLGRLSDRLDRRIVILLLYFGILSVTGAVILHFANLTPLVFFAGALFGAVALPIYSLSMAHANDMVERQDFVPMSSTLLLLYGIGATLGPLLSSLIMEFAGPRGLFIHAFIIAALMVVFISYRMFQRGSVESSTPYLPLPRTTPAIIALAAPLLRRARRHKPSS